MIGIKSFFKKKNMLSYYSKTQLINMIIALEKQLNTAIDKYETDTGLSYKSNEVSHG